MQQRLICGPWPSSPLTAHKLYAVPIGRKTSSGRNRRSASPRSMTRIGRHQRLRAAGEGSPCQDCCWLFGGWGRSQQHKANSPQANSFPYGHLRRLFFVEPRTGAAPATPSSGEVSLGVAPEVETILRVKNLLPDALKVLGDAQAVASSREQSPSWRLP